MPETIHRQVFYSGRVQGVGFRYSVKRLAAGYEVAGWVRNLADGRVELQASGAEPEVTAFLAAIAASRLADHIQRAEQADLVPAPAGRSGFHIRE